jgi:hypothetical protein
MIAEVRGLTVLTSFVARRRAISKRSRKGLGRYRASPTIRP